MLCLMDLRLKKINSKTLNLYESPISGVFWIMNEEDAKVPLAVHDVLLQIKIIVELCANYLDKGGMVFYVGTRTSSQIAVLDAVEIVPTFGVPEGVFVPVMAGGTEALIRIRTLEHVEDSGEDGAKDIGNFVLTRNDVVMGISTGGRTPYVKGALRRTKELGTKTSIICNNSRIPMAKFVDVVILVRTGPEAIAGSTRLKAGTAQKLVLYMISTTTMVKLGRVFGNHMICVNATNKKLLQRAVRIVSRITGGTMGKAPEFFGRG